MTQCQEFDVILNIHDVVIISDPMVIFSFVLLMIIISLKNSTSFSGLHST